MNLTEKGKSKANFVPVTHLAAALHSLVQLALVPRELGLL